MLKWRYKIQKTHLINLPLSPKPVFFPYKKNLIY